MSRHMPLRFVVALVLAGVAAMAAVLYFRHGSKAELPAENVPTAPGVTTRPVALYFGDPKRPALVAEGREIVLDSDIEKWMQRVIDEVLRGSMSGNRALFREECRVRGVFLESEDVVVVDFEGTPFRGEATASTCELALTALLRVISEEFPKIRRISLLVRGVPLAEVETRLAVPAVIDPRSWLSESGGSSWGG